MKLANLSLNWLNQTFRNQNLRVLKLRITKLQITEIFNRFSNLKIVAKLQKKELTKVLNWLVKNKDLWKKKKKITLNDIMNVSESESDS